MTEVLITSSALILALLVLRRVFREKISRRAQYALWLLALVRLLVPVSLPTGDFGVLSAAAPAVEAASDRLESRAVYVLPLDRAPAAEIPAADRAQPGEVLTTGDSFGYPVLSEDGATVTRYAQRLTAPELLRWVWYGGMAVMGLWFLVGNLRFRWKLRRRRRPYPVEDCPLPVYLVEGWLPSPCLVGLLRPAIYLTPAAIESEERRRHVIAHELTHRRHLDPLWTLLRSVCLTVYWFDPLVWAAALASRTDGELACDEAVLAGLDQEERLAYGRSLLALIPVRRSGGDPMLAATTMTSGKRQMKDRISRIAQSRRTTALALALVLVLCAAACAATFTGPAGNDSGGPAALGGGSPSDGGDGPLTGEELTFFATEWFNAGDIRNQFLTSLYDSPEDIDLFELFYCGNGLEETISDQELAEEGNWDEAGSLVCALVKNSRTNMDAVLTQYMGLTLAETNQVGLEYFSYREEYDAYYESHGDTNYYLQVDIKAGVREGDLIRLYYKETYFGGKRGGWACVTLRDLGDGTYHFVSNQICEKPVVPTVYPAEGLDLTISLADAEVWPLEPAETVRHSGDRTGALGIWECNGRTVWYYHSDSGEYHVGLETESGEAVDAFLTFPGEGVALDLISSSFYDLFGYDGLVLAYLGEIGDNRHGRITDYWAIPEEGGPILLARALGRIEQEAATVDLDGDGMEELVYSDFYGAHLWHLGDDGQIYHADIGKLLEEAWPASNYTKFDTWDTLGRSLPLTGQVELSDGSGVTGTAFRDLYFDGESLLLYRDTRTHTDHVMEGVKAPDDVLAAAKASALDRINGEKVSGPDGVYGLDELGGCDDWRVESVDGPWTVTAGPLTLETWSFNFEWHATDPTDVVLAGGRYITEDGWVSPGYPGCDYLYFLPNEEGEREYLFTRMVNDCYPETEEFTCYATQELLRRGLLSYPDLSGAELLKMMEGQPTAFLEKLAQAPEEDCQAALDTLIAYLSDEAISWVDEERYQSSVDYMGVFSDDASPEALALWETIQTAVAAQP